MTTQNQNPFILPGLGQTGDTASNPLLASMEMMRQAWQGLASGGGLDSGMAAPMSVDDLERRISDLRAVENWLRMNLSMLSSTIQGMEVQRSTISTLKSFMAGAAASAAQSEAKTTPFDAFWSLWQPNAGTEADAAGAAKADGAPNHSSASASADQAAASQAPAPEGAAARPASSAGAAQHAGAGAKQGKDSQADASTAEIPPALAAQALAASKGWWDMVQTQFDNLATATSASLQTAPAVPPGGQADSASTMGKAARKSAASKPAARKAAGAKSASGSAPARKTPAKRSPARSQSKPAARRTVRKSPSES